MESIHFRLKRKVYFYCEICGKDLKPDRKHPSVCCDEHLSQMSTIMKRKSVTDFTPASCKRCGVGFVKKVQQQVFCSKECNRAYSFENREFEKINNFTIFKRDNFKCVYCGLSSIEDKVKLTIDHIIPVDKGGLSIVQNLITACMGCNSAKGHRLLDINDNERVINELNKRNSILDQNQIDSIKKECSKMDNR